MCTDVKTRVMDERVFSLRSFDYESSAIVSKECKNREMPIDPNIASAISGIARSSPLSIAIYRPATILPVRAAE